MLISSKFLELTTKPLDISSVKSDKILGAKIDKIELRAAKIRAKIVITRKLFNSFSNLLIALLKSLADSVDGALV